MSPSVLEYQRNYNTNVLYLNFEQGRQEGGGSLRAARNMIFFQINNLIYKYKEDIYQEFKQLSYLNLSFLVSNEYNSIHSARNYHKKRKITIFAFHSDERIVLIQKKITKIQEEQLTDFENNYKILRNNFQETRRKNKNQWQNELYVSRKNQSFQIFYGANKSDEKEVIVPQVIQINHFASQYRECEYLTVLQGIRRKIRLEQDPQTRAAY